MAAYAVLVSLMNIIDHIQDHPLLSTCLNNKQIQTFLEKIGFLLDFVESHSHTGSKEAQVLESQIVSAAYAAEDVIESHVVDQIHNGSVSMLNLQTLIQDMDSLKVKVVNVKARGLKYLQPTNRGPAPASSTPLISTRMSRMVGFDEELIQLLDALTGHQLRLQIISIVGMGGIGKTTLARNVYEHPLILHHFDAHAWATISQEYNVREIFSKLLSLGSEAIRDLTEYQLGELMYKKLFGRRYLIILDDIWTVEAWEKIKLFFPDNDNGSRVVVTTRLSNMATHFGNSYCFPLKFLDENKSWELFCAKAFPQEGNCPPELEEIGKKIARKCKGLPQLIAVIGALLRKSSSTQEYWENISDDITPMLNSGDDEEQSLDILSLSYNHLPPHLKPCFLYMGVFPEDREIRVSQLIKLWVAEGLLKPNKTQSLEEVANSYLKDLVDRNLILVGRLGLKGNIRTCSIHDLLRELCLNVAHKEKFLCLLRASDIPRGIDKERRIVLHERNLEYHSQVFHAMESATLTRSFTINADMLLLKFRLLRVLNVVDSAYVIQEGILRQVNLRYYLSPYYGILQLPSSISLLWNLQSINFRGGREQHIAPPEIWEMRQLRHLESYEICLPEPPLSDQQDDVVLRNLQTLKTVLNCKLSEEVCKRILNINKLHLKYTDSASTSHDYSLENLCQT